MSGLTEGAAMKLVIGNTEIDFSIINNSDLVFNKSVEIPLQDLLAVLQAQNETGLPIYANKSIDISSTADRKYLERQLEVADEQNNFAADLIRKINWIIEHYPNTGGAKNLKIDIIRAIEDSMFER
jgi:stringent starvation protein B